jgi:sugar phosphate permease
MAQISQTPAANPPQGFAPDFEKRTYKRVIWRLMPFLFLCYIFAYVDRVNVGFAGLDMKKDLGMSDTVFGAGSGIFFVGYLFFQIPCNMALRKVGAKLWLGPIMIVWGLVSACTMFVRGSLDFYGIRFLLGVVESGFFPGVILYLTFWFTNRYRAQMVSIFMTAIPLSGFIFGPISGWLMKRLNNVAGLHGWQWLFVLEAAPSILAGLASMIFLDDHPGTAKWLSAEERALLCQRLDEDEAHKKTLTGGHSSFATAVRKPAVWLFCLIYFGTVSSNYGLQFWLPQIIKNTITKDQFSIGLLTMIPWGFTAIAMVLVGRHSDRTGERCYHIAIPAAIGGLGLALSAMPGISGAFGLFALSIACAGAVSASSSFWSLPALYLSGTAAAGGIALINSIGNLGGQVGPLVIGLVSSKFHSTALAMVVLAGFSWLSSAINIIYFRHRPTVKQ